MQTAIIDPEITKLDRPRTGETTDIDTLEMSACGVVYLGQPPRGRVRSSDLPDFSIAASDLAAFDHLIGAIQAAGDRTAEAVRIVAEGL